MNRPVYKILFAACSVCGGKTTNQFARAHEGKCKKCVKPLHGIQLRFGKGRKLRLLSYAIYIDNGCLVDHETTRADERACGGIERRLKIERERYPLLPII